MSIITPVMVQLIYEFIYRYGEVLTHLPFELKIHMPATDRGKRGYSNSYIAKLK